MNVLRRDLKENHKKIDNLKYQEEDLRRENAILK